MTENIEDINNDLTLNATIGNLDGVKYLIENGADINGKDSGGDTALICAVSMGRYKVVKYLVENGAKIEKGDKNGRTPLIIWALNSGQLDIAEYLIEKGADINAQDNNKNSALMYASGGGNVEIIMFLLENNKTDFNIKNENGKDFLDLINYNTLDLAISLIDDYNKKNDVKNKIKAMIDKKSKEKEK